MSNTPSLLPCPFCGGINIIHCGHHMYCHACGADGPDADSQHESEARSAWNRRTPQPVVREPLSEQDILDGLMTTPNSVLENCADAFEAGVRFAAHRHGITQKGGQHE